MTSDRDILKVLGESPTST